MRSRKLFVLVLVICVEFYGASVNAFMNAYFYLVPQPGIISFYDSWNNNSLFTYIYDQASVVEFKNEIPLEIEGYVQLANPETACKHVDPPQRLLDDLTLDPSSGKPSKGKEHILLASKSSCSYKTKIDFAEAAGFGALIIFNVGSNDTEVIGLPEEQANAPFDILVPSFFVGENGGQILKQFFLNNYDGRYFIRIETPPPRYKNVVYALVWTTLGVFMLLLALCLAKPLYECALQPLVQRHFRHRRKNLLTRTVSSLAVIEWKDELVEKYETCVICMEAYGPNALLRILPCNHGYHPACIDSWLLKVRRVCPVCKMKITYSKCWEDSSDSDISEGNYFTDAGYEPVSTSHSINRSRTENGLQRWGRRSVVEVDASDSTSDHSSLDSIGVSSLTFDTDGDMTHSSPISPR